MVLMGSGTCWAGGVSVIAMAWVGGVTCRVAVRFGGAGFCCGALHGYEFADEIEPLGWKAGKLPLDPAAESQDRAFEPLPRPRTRDSERLRCGVPRVVVDEAVPEQSVRSLGLPPEDRLQRAQEKL
jgi:hypothetical protein